jgi:uncharacterized protein YbaA (DUF1428 family)
MRNTRPIPRTAIALIILSSAVFSQSGNPSRLPDKATRLEEAVRAGNKSILEDDWAAAEVNFREAVRLEPNEYLWRIQLLISLGHQKKWKDAFAEMDTVMKNLGAVNWILSINEKMPDGKVAYVNTETFGDEERGILRYVKAVKQKKKVDSVSRDVGIKLEEFAKENKLALIYAIDTLTTKRFERGNTVDVTTAFIAYYNERRKD